MRALVILATLPAAVFSSIAAWRTAQREAPPPEPKRVQTEGVTARSSIELSFSRRWASVLDFPPATLERRRYNSPIPADMVPIDTGPIDTVRVKRRHSALRASPRDVCARHGMRKRYYRVRGWQQWRCQKSA